MKLLPTLLAFTVPLSLVGAAGAQEADTGAGGLQEVVVTARRVSENLQRVPVSVTAFTTESLSRGNVYDQYSLFSQVPGLQHYTKAGAGTATGAKVRGVQGVAYYFGGIPFPATQWIYYTPFFDVQNVQVLKGPQGTLFGQASNSGAILAEPRKPGDTWGGHLSGKTGDYGLKSIEGALDIPLLTDHLMMRVAAADYFRDGFIKDTISGSRLGEDNYDIVRAILVFKANENFQNELLFQSERVRDFATTRTLNTFNVLPQNPRLATNATVNGMTVPQMIAARDQILATQIALGPYKLQGWSTGCPATANSPVRDSTVPGPNFSSVVPSACVPWEGGDAKNRAAINTTTWSFTEQLSIKNILGYTWGESRSPTSDNDFTRLIMQDSNPRGYQWQEYAPQFTEELQLIGDLGNFDFVSGAFYYRSKINPDSPNYAQFLNNLNSAATITATDNRSWAVYGQGNYDLSALLSGLTVTAGLRYTEDKFIRTNYVLNPTTLAVTSVTGGPGVPGGEGNWDAVSYTFGLQYQLRPETMLYFTNSKGYSSGGLQNIPDFFTFDPDTLNNFEVGMKSTNILGAWQVRTNLAAYYGIFDKVKVTQSVVYTIPGTNSQTVNSGATQNAGEAVIKGFEAEFGATNGRFDLSGFVAWSQAHFTEYLILTGASLGTVRQIDRSDDPFSNTPKWKVGVSPTFHFPIEGRNIGDISVFANFSYTSSYWTNFSKPIVPLTPGDPDTGAICKERRTAANGYGPLSADGGMAYLNCTPDWRNLNVGMSWKDILGREKFDATLLVTNATGYEGMRGLNSAYDGSGFNTSETNLPRFISLSLRYEF